MMVGHNDPVTELPQLDAAEQRILGSLLEKELTVPGSYPLTLNAVRTAANQTSSREPVTDYDERTVNETLKRLRDADLVTTTWAGAGQRAVKFAQTIAHRAGWTPAQRALLTVLLLRGPQPAGALKTRTERLYAFDDRAAVETELAAMAAAEQPLVRQLPRQAGQHDPRWIHLLGPVEHADGAAPAEPAADLDTVLAAGGPARDDRVRAAYGTVARSYADNFDDELADGEQSLPFERWLLDRIAALAGDAPIADAGCGPGHVTAYLNRRGAHATGIDLTEEMVEQARERHPEGDYAVGDLRQLLRPTGADGWGAVLAWYSLIHLAGSELAPAIAALARPLRPGGWLLVALHAGAEVIGLDRWFGHAIDLDFVLHPPDSVRAAAEAAGLTDIEWYLRGPQAGETTTRYYLLGRRAPEPGA